MVSKYHLQCLWIALLTTLAGTACLSDDAVQIFVGNKPLELNQSIPAVLAEDVYVPIRQFAEAMGAEVNWDGGSGTVTIVGTLASGTMRIGSQVAQIKGTQVSLPYAPFLHRGKVFGPILFFNETFDQAWVFDPLTRQFFWVPIFPRYRGGLEYPPPLIIRGPGRRTTQERAVTVPATRTVVGEAMRVNPSVADPKVILRTAGKTISYPVAGDVTVLRGELGGRAVEVPLAEVRPGDRVTLRFDEGNRVTWIRAQYRLVRGEVRSISKDAVELQGGVNLKVARPVEVILSANNRGSLEDLQARDTVIARVGPISGRTFAIKILSQADEIRTEEDQITLNTFGPLREGDTLVVTFRASPAGRAFLTIPGVEANMPMTETETGVYQGRYTVRPGDVLTRQPIKITFTAPGGEVYQRFSSRPVIIETAGGYLPRILSPHQGEEIDSPLVVNGMAEPGSLVRVTIEYRRDVQGFFPVEGISAVEEVRANEKGLWETPPLSANTPFVEGDADVPVDFGIFSDIYRLRGGGPILYTITAISVGAGGEGRAAYMVEVRRKEGIG